MSSKFEIKKSKDGQFYFVLKAKNGEIILQSETYTRKENCKKGIESVRKNAVLENAYNVHPKFFSVRSLSNGKILSTSEQYSSTSARDKGIASVKKNAPIADIIDLTV